jgi:hypothetical protein
MVATGALAVKKEDFAIKLDHASVSFKFGNVLLVDLVNFRLAC